LEDYRPTALPPHGGTKLAKFLFIFLGRAQKNSSNKERKFCGFCLFADAETNRFPPLRLGGVGILPAPSCPRHPKSRRSLKATTGHIQEKYRLPFKAAEGRL